MSRLIATYRKLPSITNRNKLQAYIDKHMMALCRASADEVEFLKANEFKV